MQPTDLYEALALEQPTRFLVHLAARRVDVRLARLAPTAWPRMTGPVNVAAHNDSAAHAHQYTHRTDELVGQLDVVDIGSHPDAVARVGEVGFGLCDRTRSRQHGFDIFGPRLPSSCHPEIMYRARACRWSTFRKCRRAPGPGR